MKAFAIILCTGLAVGAAAQAASRPPDGTYTCIMLSGSMLMTLGTLEIDGDRYRGFSPTEWAEYSMTGTDGIRWHGTFSGLPDGYTLNEGQLTTDSQGGPMVRVNYTSVSGWSQTVDCTPE